MVDAEQRVGDLEERGRTEGNCVLFKMKNDPRVKPIGRYLRRYSLDELPQPLNVYWGSVPLVGSHLPLKREVALYDPHVHSRFLVKPGITGLWQVSGPSHLSWEDGLHSTRPVLCRELVAYWRPDNSLANHKGRP